jgi:hypothetical protein
MALLAGVVAAQSLKPDPEQILLPPPPPEDVTVTFNFLNGPNLVYLCWNHYEEDVTFFDVKVEAWDGGGARPEVRYGVNPTDCSGAYGNGQYMWQPGIYHFAVRACNNGGCSAWADATDGAFYWHAVPCTDGTGQACVRINLARGSP